MTVYFGDLSLERASEYLGAMAWVREHVKPARDLHSEPQLRKWWWLYKRPTVKLYESIKPLQRCFAFSRHTKHWALVAQGQKAVVFTEALKIVATDRWDVWAALQSTLHEVWARKHSGAIKADLRYSPTRCFQTFPFPGDLLSVPQLQLERLGEVCHEHRRRLMRELWLGLTDIYNLFHTRDLSTELVAKVSKKPADVARASFDGLLELRRLHVELDNAVRDAYGWTDLNLDHDFVEVETLPENDRVRYTISPTARKEVLKRLLALNHHRAKEEAARTPAAKPKGAGRKKAAASAPGPGLFEDL